MSTHDYTLFDPLVDIEDPPRYPLYAQWKERRQAYSIEYFTLCAKEMLKLLIRKYKISGTLFSPRTVAEILFEVEKENDAQTLELVKGMLYDVELPLFPHDENDSFSHEVYNQLDILTREKALYFW